MISYTLHVMPYIVRKIRNLPLYTVKNKETGEVKSKASSKTNAIKQVRLLEQYDKTKQKSKAK